ncbi:hypothetical protein TWF730_007586 [Orbilia blumenaviensis]|uniref:Clr5 domain-containing protein n=1 Tax=Orbilia blumenaviensis TaxID=1796055 RepID=A0AAV9VBG2_9PEZI
MSSSGVKHGRITKKARDSRRSTSNQLVKCASTPQALTSAVQAPAGRAKPIKNLTDYDVVIKYYYLTRGYTLEQLHGVMEIIFRIGATVKQYGGYISANKENFRKKVTREEWIKIAPYFYACEQVEKEVAVKINGLYVLPPSTVKKEIPRNITLSQKPGLLRQSQQGDLSERPIFPLGRIEAYTTSASSQHICQKIPTKVLNQLPIFSSEKLLLEVCRAQIKQKGGTSKELSRVANSGYFKYLRVLLYKLSNNLAEAYEIDELLDDIMKFGYWSSLKELLSLNILSIRMAAENMLPVLVVRLDEDLIHHIFTLYGQDYTGRVWYDTFLNCCLGDEDLARGTSDYFPEKIIPGPNFWRIPDTKLIEFIANGIKRYQAYARTVSESVVLLACCLRSSAMELDTMLALLPRSVSWADIERTYTKAFHESILERRSGREIQRRLKVNFCLNLHLFILKSALTNNEDALRNLLPYSSRITLNGGAGGLQHTRNTEGFVWDKLGVEGFNILMGAFVEETLAYGGKTPSDICLFDFAFNWNDTDSGGFLVRYYKAYRSKDYVANMLTKMMWAMLTDGLRCGTRSYGLDCHFCSLFFTSRKKSDSLRYRQPRWCEFFLENGADISAKYGTKLPLHLAVEKWAPRLSLLILRQGQFDVNTLNEDQCSPLDLFVLEHKLTITRYPHQRCRCGEDFEEHRVFLEHLVQSGAQLHKQDFIFEGKRRELKPAFVDALLASDIGLLVEMWPDRWIPLSPIIEPSNPLSEDLEEWMRNPPQEADRARRVATTNNYLKFEGPQLDWHRDLFRIPAPVKPTESFLHQIGMRSLNYLETFILIGEPTLLHTAFSFYRPETSTMFCLCHENRLSLAQLAVVAGNNRCLDMLQDNGLQTPWSLTPVCLSNSYRALLYFAIEIGDIDITKRLIEYGALAPGNHHRGLGSDSEDDSDFSESDYFAETEVQLAVRLGRLDFIALLLSYDINLRYKARRAAVRHNRRTIQDWLDENWMTKPHPNPPQTRDHIGPPQQLEASGSSPS